MSDTITISRTDYDALLERIEDLEDALLFDRRRNDETIPFAITARIIEGANPVTVWREHRGLSQRALAERSGVSASMLNEIERGKRTPSMATARAIAAALDLGLDDLFGDDQAEVER